MRADLLTSGGVLILAAGSSRRFGADKRFHVMPDGRTLLLASIDLYAAVFEHVCVVLRATEETLAEELGQLPCHPVLCLAADAHLGMGHSLAAGIRRIAGAWPWAAVALADMPFIRPETLMMLGARFEKENGILQPEYQGQPGHPVFFPGRFFPALQALTGDAGARTVLQAHAGDLLRIPVQDSGVITDLDTPPPQH